MNIYLAGKVSKNCWRHDVVPGLRGSWSNGVQTVEHEGEWPVLENALGHGLHYAGPFFVSCDHGCAHIDGAHGTAECGVGNSGIDPCSRRDVADRCVRAIRVADVVLARVRHDSHGTLAEIGYAVALKKPVILQYEDKKSASDAWFVGALPGVIVVRNVLAVLDYWNGRAESPQVCNAIACVQSWAQIERALKHP